MSRLLGRQMLLSILWATDAACVAAVAVIEAIRLHWWLVLIGVGLTFVGALAGVGYAVQTRRIARRGGLIG